MKRDVSDRAVAEPTPNVTWRLRGQLDGLEHTFELTPGEYRVGSSSRCDVRLPMSGVSREHALLEVAADGLAVVDQGSKNGTFVDRSRIERAGVPPGSTVAFGPVELVVEDVHDDDRELALTVDPAVDEPGIGADHPSHDTQSMLDGVERPVLTKLVLPDDYLVAPSSAMVALYHRMEMLVHNDLPVLILGETGVGKERLASILHESSIDRRGPLVAINCAAIPAELLEAELFGIGKGVATGVDPRPGKFRLADGGTLFLDEIGEMMGTLQAKLLRVLQEKQIQPVGGAPEPVDVRIVAATNADLHQRIERGTFRRDLYFRLSGSTLEVPPLRACRPDIAPLVEFFLRRFSREARTRIRGVTVRALRCLVEYDWPGNVRELEHEIRQAVYRTAHGGTIDAGKLSAQLTRERAEAGSPAPTTRNLGDVESSALESIDDLDLDSRLRELEESLIREALRRTRGRQVQAAKLLGISRNGLANKLERFGIDYRTFRKPEENVPS